MYARDAFGIFIDRNYLQISVVNYSIDLCFRDKWEEQGRALWAIDRSIDSNWYD